MSTVRVSFWAAVGLILLTVVAWSLLVIFLQTVSASVARVERQVQAGFNPLHLGQQSDSGCLPRPGIPLEASSARRIGGKDLADWLQVARGLKNDASLANQTGAGIGKKTGANIRSIPLLTAAAGTTFPIEKHGSGTVIMLIALPPDYSLPAGHEGGSAMDSKTLESVMQVMRLMIETEKNEKYLSVLNELPAETRSPRLQEATP